jgi:hypothetical protein
MVNILLGKAEESEETVNALMSDGLAKAPVIKGFHPTYE